MVGETSEAEQQRRALVRAYHRFVLSTEGQAVLGDLERVFRYRLPALVPGADGKLDPNQLLYADGQRSVVCYIHEVLRQMPLDDTEENPTTPKVRK